jgi:hypothetical protein
MASYPSGKVHRVNRRKLGRGQYPTAQAVTVTAAGSGSTVVLTFSRPVVVSGPVSLTVATLTYVSQVINSPTQVTVTMSGTVATHAYTIAGPQPYVTAANGGTVAGTSGTF